MKFTYSIALLVFLSLLGWSAVQAQSTRGFFEEVGESLLRASVDDLVSDFDDRIEITLLGRRQEYSKAQAQYVMTQFFEDYPPTSFGFVQVGNSQADGTAYATGVLRSNSGAFEVNIFVRVSEARHRVIEIRFDQE